MKPPFQLPQQIALGCQPAAAQRGELEVVCAQLVVELNGEGVERVFPVNSPRIAKIEIERKGEVHRAKLNYLRKRKGKSATAVREKSTDKST